jgi:threonine dehydratase
VAIAVKSARPDVEVVGVQVESCARSRTSCAAATSSRRARRSRSPTASRSSAGAVTLPLVREWLDDVVTVARRTSPRRSCCCSSAPSRSSRAPGAVGVAALLVGRTPPPPRARPSRSSPAGNVDAGLLAEVARRHETEVGRRLLVQSRIGDRPGELARLLAVVGDAGANLIEVQHVREGLDLHVRETAVQLVLETRGRDHARAVLEAIRAAGYEARVLR